jgi:hypothetical protein
MEGLFYFFAQRFCAVVENVRSPSEKGEKMPFLRFITSCKMSVRFLKSEVGTGNYEA